jgi:enediyne biosynthesis protein E4
MVNLRFISTKMVRYLIRKLFGVFWILMFVQILASCKKESQLFLKLDPNKSRITFENTLTPTEDFNIIDYLYFYNGGGVSIGDINNDGLVDLFFTGNQVKNRLYLNKGNLVFEDITDHAGVAGSSSWNTGGIMGDVNGDGLLDIYVCAVVGLKNLRGHNELFINNGDNTFTERSAEFGLNFDTYSSSAAFLDFDLDGDLDIYLLNHAIHSKGSFGHANLRHTRTYETGDKLLRNDGGKYTDVSEEANIYGGINGYGLGIAISDFNLDGYPDIYIGNDFHEDDYLYINNGDGTFKNISNSAFTYTSKFSMGNDVADINHDGYPDIISLDMLPQDEEIIKRSEGDENITILKMRTGEYGYGYQFERNVLQINQGNGVFLETAMLSNVAATDWSWSALFADFNLDGNQDLFISNGIPKRPNDLDYIKYVSSDHIVNTMGTTKLVDQKALALMPSGMQQNYIYKGSGGLKFEDKSLTWLPVEKTCSTAAAFGDLDNDGDLDIVVNNVNEKPGIYINQTNATSNYLKVKLNYTPPNVMGFGARVHCYYNGILQAKEMYNVRGFQASSEPIIHFGFGNRKVIDSLKVFWPNGFVQALTNVSANQTLTISFDTKLQSPIGRASTLASRLFEKIENENIGLTFRHKEDRYTDFDRLKLLPYQQSDRGPATAVGDLNNDGLLDLYFGGSKHIPSEIFIQSGTGFVKSNIMNIQKDSIKEEVVALIRDFNKDGKYDLFIGSGGADFYGKSKPLLDSYYESTDSGYRLIELENYYENAGCVIDFDFDGDGDLDIFIGNQSVSNDFGAIPHSCLLLNEGGKFTPIQRGLFDKLGMVTDAIWHDYNNDGLVDLIVVGEWMEPTFLKNTGHHFERESLLNQRLGGLWQSIEAFDIDEDGDMDYVLGNWGLNSKFKATNSNPMRMYYSDFDLNGQSETILAIEKNGRYYPLDGLDLLASQMPSLRKKYTSYKSFAGQSVDEIFTKQELKSAKLFEVHQLASGYLRNDNGKFTFVPLSIEFQIAPIMAQLKFDFDLDGKQELLLAGNYFGVQPFYGRFGSFPGAVIKKDGKVLSGLQVGLHLVNKSVRHLNIINVNNQNYLIVTINNDDVQVYKLLKQ